MFLSPGTIDDPLYSGQAFVQTVLLLVALVSVPWMLLTKPYLLWKKNKKIVEQGYTALGGAVGGRVYDDEYNEDEEGPDRDAHPNARVSSAEANGNTNSGAGQTNGGHEEMDTDHKDEFDMGEIAVHQVIHTIEFCLGCISNTASYLRLWALSLAHAQLSEVLWSMTISRGFSMFSGIPGVIFLFIMFAFWLALTGTYCHIVVENGMADLGGNQSCDSYRYGRSVCVPARPEIDVGREQRKALRRQASRTSVLPAAQADIQILNRCGYSLPASELRVYRRRYLASCLCDIHSMSEFRRFERCSGAESAESNETGSYASCSCTATYPAEYLATNNKGSGPPSSYCHKLPTKPRLL